MNHSRWKMPPRLTAEQLARTKGLPPLMVQLLYNRGITEPAQVEPFLAADKRLLGDPFLDERGLTLRLLGRYEQAFRDLNRSLELLFAPRRNA